MTVEILIRIFKYQQTNRTRWRFICNSISSNCFLLTRDWKLENVIANVKQIYAVPFLPEKEDYLWN